MFKTILGIVIILFSISNTSAVGRKIDYPQCTSSLETTARKAMVERTQQKGLFGSDTVDLLNMKGYTDAQEDDVSTFFHSFSLLNHRKGYHYIGYVFITFDKSTCRVRDVKINNFQDYSDQVH